MHERTTKILLQVGLTEEHSAVVSLSVTVPLPWFVSSRTIRLNHLRTN